MSRIKTVRLLSFVLAVLLFMNTVVLASEPQDIIDASQMTPQQFNYQTIEAERGSLIKKVTIPALKYYPLTYSLRFDNNGAKFVEYLVEYGDTVKAGDILARFTVSGSEAEFTRMELDLQRAQEQINTGIREREQIISQLRSQIAAESDENAKEILELSLQKQETEMKQFKLRQQYTINRLREEYEEENTRRRTDILVSPVSGIVTELTYKKVDDAVSADETLIVISSGDIMLLQVNNETGDLRYNMPVQIQAGNNPNPVTLTGRVIAADDAIPEKERSGYAFIQLDTDGNEDLLKNPKIVAESVKLDNIVLVNRDAVKQEGGKYYVTKLTDGMAQKRYVEIGMNNLESVWILSGVEEGETLVLE